MYPFSAGIMSSLLMLVSFFYIHMFDAEHTVVCISDTEHIYLCNHALEHTSVPVSFV